MSQAKRVDCLCWDFVLVIPFSYFMYLTLSESHWRATVVDCLMLSRVLGATQKTRWIENFELNWNSFVVFSYPSVHLLSFRCCVRRKRTGRSSKQLCLQNVRHSCPEWERLWTSRLSSTYQIIAATHK